ncbi:MAG TPA: GIY-YIG nuclease family protein [Rhizomicrobium sp.]|nr:GIY-YIG nuclease family protein [Rhizomicrobium sp.]
MAGLVPATHILGGSMVAGDAYNTFIAVYMIANRRHGTIYIVVTSQLPKRIWEHREGLAPGFTKKYGLTRLVWFEPHESMVAAIQRETSLKRYERGWKINLIERENTYWIDLYPWLMGYVPTKNASTDL